MTYWCRCSRLWKPPSHGRRLRVRPVRSPGTADIWCCAAVSSGGRMPRSSWLLEESFHRHISRISSVVLGDVDRPHQEEPGRSFPIDAPWISSTHAAPGGVHPPQKPHRHPLDQGPSMLPDLAHPKLPSGLQPPSPRPPFTALLHRHDDARTVD